MNASFIRCLEVITYAQIEVEAMKAANAERADKGLAQAYPEEAFIRVAENMRGAVNESISFIS